MLCMRWTVRNAFPSCNFLTKTFHDEFLKRPNAIPFHKVTTSCMACVDGAPQVRVQAHPPNKDTSPVAVAIPPAPNFYGLGARVEHVLASREDVISSLVVEALGLSKVTVAMRAVVLTRICAICLCRIVTKVYFPPVLHPVMVANTLRTSLTLRRPLRPVCPCCTALALLHG